MAHERNVSNSSGGNDTRSNYMALRARLALDIKIKGRLKVDYAAVSSIYELAASATRRCFLRARWTMHEHALWGTSAPTRMAHERNTNTYE